MGLSTLDEFKGYTVDLKLKEFRKYKFGETPETIEFDSPKGQKLLHEYYTQKRWK